MKFAFRFLVIVSLLAGCAEEDALNYAEVHCSVQGAPLALFNERLLVTSGNLNMERIDATATGLSGTPVSASHAFPPSTGEFVFVGSDPRQPVKLNFVANVYRNLKLDFYLIDDPYELVLRDTVIGATPPPPPPPGNENPGGGDGNENPDGGNGTDGGEDQDDDDDSGSDGDNDSDDDDDSDDEGDDSGDGDDDSDDDDGDDSGDGDDDEDSGSAGDNGDNDDDENDRDDDDDEDDDDRDDDEGDDDDRDDDDNDDRDDDDDDDNDDRDDDDDDDNDDDGRKNVTGKTVDLAHFLANAKPSLLLLGNYDDQATAFTILIALNAPQKISTTGPAAGSDSLALSNNHVMNATAVFDLPTWFEGISAEELLSAQKILFRGQTVLFIHRDFNKALHDKIAVKVQPSLYLDVEVQSKF